MHLRVWLCVCGQIVTRRNKRMTPASHEQHMRRALHQARIVFKCQVQALDMADQFNYAGRDCLGSTRGANRVSHCGGDACQDLA